MTSKREFQLFSPIYGLRKNEHSPTYMTKFTKRSARGSRFCLLCCQPVPVRRLSCARTVQLTPRSPCAPWACSTKQDSRGDHRAQRLPHNCHAVATQLPRSCHTFATGKIRIPGVHGEELEFTYITHVSLECGSALLYIFYQWQMCGNCVAIVWQSRGNCVALARHGDQLWNPCFKFL